MLNKELVSLLLTQDPEKEVKIRHKSMTIADIDNIRILSFCEEPSMPTRDVIVIDNEKLSKEGYR
jgi:hypothetical protein